MSYNNIVEYALVIFHLSLHADTSKHSHIHYLGLYDDAGDGESNIYIYLFMTPTNTTPL